MKLASDSLIETFDPASNTKKKWHLHEMTTHRYVKYREVLLYRACGVLDGEGMTEQIAKLLPASVGESKTRKRPVDAIEVTPQAGPSRKIRQHLEDTVSAS
jgi:hypothetical protein